MAPVATSLITPMACLLIQSFTSLLINGTTGKGVMKAEKGLDLKEIVFFHYYIIFNDGSFEKRSRKTSRKRT